MKRFLQDHLQAWYQKANRKPLILRGARQVGKSTLVRQFAQENGLKLLEINLEKFTKLDAIFQTNQSQNILLELESVLQQKVQGENCILFLDEIQATPHALPALRYFYEDLPNLPVIAAGSLLEFVLSEHKFSMPVGRIEYLHMGPMSFHEFLLAMGHEYFFNLIQEYKIKEAWPIFAHEKLLELQRLYLFIGGMPECVLTYSKTQSVTDVHEVQRSILQAYQDDFAKYSHLGTERQLLHKIFDVFPRIAGTKIKYVHISRENRAAEIKLALYLLVKARILLTTHHSNCSGLPLRAGRDDTIFKLYFLDCGLFNHLCGVDWSQINRLSERELLNEGFLAEQFVAQHLAYQTQSLDGPELFYWLRETAQANAEVDFIVTCGKHIIPIEVKAGASGSLKSLQQFMNEKNSGLACRFDLNLPSLQIAKHRLTSNQKIIDYQFLSLPLYFVEKAHSILNDLIVT